MSEMLLIQQHFAKSPMRKPKKDAVELGSLGWLRARICDSRLLCPMGLVRRVPCT